jgi:hypothetical protein
LPGVVVVCRVLCQRGFDHARDPADVALGAVLRIPTQSKGCRLLRIATQSRARRLLRIATQSRARRLLRIATQSKAGASGQSGEW